MKALEATEGGYFSFPIWLRTGRLIRLDARWGAREVKFNPYHDARSGRFTFKNGGASSAGSPHAPNVSRKDEPKPVKLKDGSTVPNPTSPNGILMQPPGVSLEQNAAEGASWLGVTASYHMYENFKPGGAMDYQRKFGTDGLINRSYIDFGNYNYGVVAAAAKYTLEEAQAAAGAANLLGKGRKSGTYFGNPRNQIMITAGWLDYMHGRIGH